MKSRLLIFWENIRANFWFLPAVLILGILALLRLTLWLDAAPAFQDLLSHTGLQFGSSDGAREILATIAGALIALIATLFSLTMVVFTIASSHYGILLLRRFMKDRTTQLTLAVFISTFVYCILTLRSIREGGSQISFLPHLTINFALVLTLISMVFLIYFIHHIALQIQAPNVLTTLYHGFLHSIKVCFSAPAEHTKNGVHAEVSEETLKNKTQAVQIQSAKDGYIQTIDYEEIVLLAEKNQLEVELLVKVGDFKVEGQNLAIVYGGAQSKEVLTHIQNSILIGNFRTAHQDVRFAAQQLVEVAQRALSPGINEVLVAIMCINHLSAGLVRIARRKATPCCYYDQRDHLRLVCPPVTFEELFETTFGVILEDARTHNAAVDKLREQTFVIRESVHYEPGLAVVHRFLERAQPR